MIVIKVTIIINSIWNGVWGGGSPPGEAQGLSGKYKKQLSNVPRDGFRRSSAQSMRNRPSAIPKPLVYSKVGVLHVFVETFDFPARQEDKYSSGCQ